MFARLENFLTVLAIAAIGITAAFWVPPPELRFPDPRPDAGVSGLSPVVAPMEAAPAATPVPALPTDELSARQTRSKPPSPVTNDDPDEMGPRLAATLSLVLREKLPDASLPDDDIRELMGRTEKDRHQLEKTIGMSIAEFVQRTTTNMKKAKWS